MGKLADAIKAYKIAPINSPAEREAKEIIIQITESQWWKDNVGREFKMPKKYDNKKHQAIFTEPQFLFFGNFIIPRFEFCEKCRLYKGLLTYNSGQMLYAKPYIT
jgi:hypothetical protein